MGTDAHRNLIEVWNERRPAYERLAKAVELALKAGLRAKGMRCEVTSRVKSVESFIKKMVRKGYSEVSEITDMAGARVVCLFEEDRVVARLVAEEAFTCTGWEDKREALKPHELGYLGLHCQASLRGEVPPDLRGLECELQFHTTAEHAWSAPLHDLVYKPPEGIAIPPQVSRAAYRLAALTEVYDGELSRTRNSVLRLPGYKYGQILRSLDSHYYALTDRGYDRSLSTDVIQALEPLYASQSAEEIDGQIATFVSKVRGKLQSIYSEHESIAIEESAFLFQPESILIFEALERDPFALKAAWRMEPRLLEFFSLVWGKSLE